VKHSTSPPDNNHSALICVVGMVNPSDNTMDYAISSQPPPKSWLDDLIAQTRKSSQIELIMTENFVSSLEKYNSIFIELFLQTKLFNEPVTILLSKAWQGTMHLMDNVIKSYQKYTRDASETLKQVQDKLREKAKEDCGLRIKDENLALNGTLLRAQIRGLEAEAESMRISQNSYINEIHYLRIVVDEYLRSAEVEHPMSRQYSAKSRSSNLGKQNGTEKAKNAEIIVDENIGSKKRIENVPQAHNSNLTSSMTEVGRQNLKVLRETEEAMGEVMSSIWKEEDRQRVLLQDLDKLFKQQSHSHSQLDSNNHDSTSNRTNNSSSHKYDPSISTIDSIYSSSNSRKHGATTKLTNIGPDFSGPTVESKKQTIKLRVFRDASVQVDERDSYGAVDEAFYPRSFSGPKSDGRDLDPKFLPPAFSYIEQEPSLLAESGWNVPYKLRELMTYFPKILRIPPVDRVLQTIMAIYIRKIESDEKQNGENQNCLILHEIVYSYFTDFFGLKTIADLQVRYFL
jgi:hypothetical protein